MTIQLNKIQFEYLLCNLSEEQRQDFGIRNMQPESIAFCVDINNDMIDEIRDWANEVLQKKGFDENYELTKEGEILESLVDIFYTK